MALGAGAVGRVEGEAARFELRHVDAAGGAGQPVGVKLLVAFDHGHDHQPLGELERGVERGFQAFLDTRFDQQAVHHHLDGVVAAPVQLDGLVQRVQLPVDAGAGPALPAQRFQLLAELAFAPAHDRRQDHDARRVPVAVPVQLHDGLHDLLGGLAGDGARAARAVGRADRAIEQAQVVVDFGDGADGRARRARGGLLLDGDGGGEALDRVHVRAFELVEELPGVGAERFDVAALALGVDGVKGERGLARPAQPGDHRQGVARDADADVLQVVGAGAADGDGFDHVGVDPFPDKTERLSAAQIHQSKLSMLARPHRRVNPA